MAVNIVNKPIDQTYDDIQVIYEIIMYTLNYYIMNYFLASLYHIQIILLPFPLLKMLFGMYYFNFETNNMIMFRKIGIFK